MKKIIAYILSFAIVLSNLQIGAVQVQAAPAASTLAHYGNGFETHYADQMDMADWSNGDMFNCKWEPGNISFDGDIMTMKIDRNSGGYTGGEYRTKEYFGYGMYQVCMKPIKNDGVVSSFFTYTGPADGTTWDEIDIEFLGKDTTHVQFNYYVDGVADHEMWYDLGFDASEEFHVYGFNWYEGGITWYVDGVPVYTATGPDKKGSDKYPSHPSKIMMNVWPGINVDDWLNPYNGKTPLYAYYDWISYDAPTGVSDSGTGTEGSDSGTGSGDSGLAPEPDASQYPESPDWLNFNTNWWYKIISKNSGKSVDVDHGYTENGTNILQYGYKEDGNAENQQWMIEKQENGFFTIKNRKTDKVLTVEDFSTELGGNVHQWEYVGNSNQEWSIIPSGDYYKIKNRHSGYLLTVAYESMDDNANVEQYQDENGDAQLWLIECIHPQKETRDAREATCTEDGYTGNEYCSVCSKLLSEGTVIPKTGHSWGVGMVTKEATFSESGEMLYICTLCGATKTESIPKLVCSHEETEIKEGSAKEATCSEEGYTGDVVCSICGVLISQGTMIAKTAHTWDDGKVIKPATVTEKGIMQFTCSECGETREVEYEADIPETSDGSGSTEEPGNAGSTEESGNAGSTEESGNAGSTEESGNAGSTEESGNAGSTEESGNAGSTEESGNAGSTEEQGSGGTTEEKGNAGSTEEQESPGNTEESCSHQSLIWVNIKEATCQETGYTGDIICKDCNKVMVEGIVIERSSHSWGDPKVTKVATAEKDGEITFTCTVCDETSTIPYTAETVETTEEEINRKAAEEVIAAIYNIGTVTLSSYASIQSAKEAYANLTDEQKKLVTNYEDLEKAEAAYNQLKKEYDEALEEGTKNQIKANAVIESITSLGDENDITLKDGDRIKAARNAYEALTPAQKELVSQEVVEALEKAEVAYQALKDAYDEMQQAADEDAAKLVIEAIDEIGTVTLEKAEVIQKARSLYDALTPAQKKLVTNYGDLEKAEAAYKEELDKVATSDGSTTEEKKDDNSSEDNETVEGDKNDGSTGENNTTEENGDNGSSEDNETVEGDQNNGSTEENNTTEEKGNNTPSGNNGTTEGNGNNSTPSTEIPGVGKVLTASNGAKYKVLSVNGNTGKVEYKAPKNKNVSSVSIPATVKIGGISYKVTSIAKKAFKGCKKLTKVKIGNNVQTIGASAFQNCGKLKKVTIGKNVKKIGTKAFYGDRKLTTIIINTSKLTSKNVKSKAFAKTNEKVTVKVPKAKRNAYKTWLVKKGINKKANIKKK